MRRPGRSGVIGWGVKLLRNVKVQAYLDKLRAAVTKQKRPSESRRLPPSLISLIKQGKNR